MWLFQGEECFPCWLHVHAQSGKGIKRLEDVIIERFARGKLVGKKCGRGVLRFQKGQRVFADPEIPVWVSDPFHVQLFLKSKWRIQVRPPDEFIENDAIVNALDPHLS